MMTRTTMTRTLTTVLAMFLAPAALAGAEPAVSAPSATPPASTPAETPANAVDSDPLPADDDGVEPSREQMFKTISDGLKRPGVTKDDVMTITVPRDDLDVRVEGVD